MSLVAWDVCQWGPTVPLHDFGAASICACDNRGAAAAAAAGAESAPSCGASASASTARLGEGTRRSRVGCNGGWRGGQQIWGGGAEVDSRRDVAEACMISRLCDQMTMSS